MNTIRAIIILTIVSTLSFHAAAETPINQNVIQPSVKTRDRASKAMNNLLHGPIGPYHDPSPSRKCSGETAASGQDATSGSGKEIAKVISGAWQIATFWCTDTGDAAGDNRSTKK